MHEVWSMKDEAAYWPHHTGRAVDWDSKHRLKWGWSEGIMQTERGIYWWKLILKGWYWLRVSEKYVHVCTVNTDLVSMGVGFGIRNGLGYWWWSWKGLRQPSRPTASLYRRDRRAATDVLCGTNRLYDQCLVESTAQTKLVRRTEHEIQQ